MLKEKQVLLDYIKNVNTDLLHARFCVCPEDWRNMDYTPAYSKFYFICGGEGWLKIDGAEYYPKPGEMYLMPAGTRQSYSVTGSHTFTKYFCHFTASVGNISLFDLVHMPHYVTVKKTGTMENLFKGLLECMHTHTLSSGFRVKAALLELIAAYVEEAGETDIYIKKDGSSEVMHHILRYINDHLAEKLSVEMLANLVHYHPAHFRRFFKKHMLVSPKSYINMKRLDKAKNLLGASGMSISQIAGNTGYSDVFYFSNLFKNHFGQSPSEYRSTFLGETDKQGEKGDTI